LKAELHIGVLFSRLKATVLHDAVRVNKLPIQHASVDGDSNIFCDFKNIYFGYFPDETIALQLNEDAAEVYLA